MGVWKSCSTQRQPDKFLMMSSLLLLLLLLSTERKVGGSCNSQRTSIRFTYVAIDQNVWIGFLLFGNANTALREQ